VRVRGEASGVVIDVMYRRTDGSNLVRSHKYSCLPHSGSYKGPAQRSANLVGL
jgi:phosphoglycerate dehydrogenase-like enzyme